MSPPAGRTRRAIACCTLAGSRRFSISRTPQRPRLERITIELALTWAWLPVNAHPHYWRQRLSVVRGFARHLATIDPTSEIPSKDLLPGHRPRIAPYIYTEKEIAALMAAAVKLKRVARGASPDADRPVGGHREAPWGGARAWPPRCRSAPRRGARSRRQQKKQREVPLHQSTIRALREYARVRDRAFPEPSTPAFFVSARGRRMARSELNQTFTRLIRQVRLDGRGARARPRPHDLRHALAVHTLLDWHEAARTSTGGCRSSPPCSGMPTRPAHTGIWRRCPNCSS